MFQPNDVFVPEQLRLDNWDILRELEGKGYNFRTDIDNLEDDPRSFDELTDDDVDWFEVGRVSMLEGYAYSLSCDCFYSIEKLNEQ